MIGFKVSAPGKIILCGEHAVVYGKTAVAASLDLHTVLEFKELADHLHIHLSMPKIGLLLNISVQQMKEFLFNDNVVKLQNNNYEATYSSVQKFVEKIGYNNVSQKLSLEAFFYLLVSISEAEQIKVKPFQVYLDTALSVSSGLGSSASFAVCLATCFLHWSHLQKNMTTVLDNTQLEIISNYALNCEKIMHGTPSGIDNSVCTFGSIIEFRRGSCLEPIIGAKSMKVLLVDTRVQRSTKALIGRVTELKHKYPKVFDPILDSIDNVSKEALNVIRRIRDLPEEYNKSYFEAYKELMTLIEVNQGLLSSCQVSHPSLDRICTEAKNYSLAAKLTGAGGGGYAYILLLPDTPNETIASISKKLIANGYLVTLTTLGGCGVQIQS